MCPATRLKRTFSRTTYSAIAGIFGLDPADTALVNIPQFNMQRSWLPLAVVYEICSDVETVNVKSGPMIIYDNEEVRRRYIAAVCHPRSALVGDSTANIFEPDRR